MKELATVFYAWVLYTRIDALLSSPGEPSEVLGAGRALRTPAEFDPRNPEVAEAIAFYRDLADTVRASGSELLVVYFPLSYAIHREDESRWRHLGVRDVEAQIAFDEAFVRYLQELGIDCLDVSPDLRRAAAEGRRLYYWLDIHWTAEGNAVVADAVARHLLAQQRPRSRRAPRPLRAGVRGRSAAVRRRGARVQAPDAQVIRRGDATIEQQGRLHR
jgi:hypothetical protein